jgi:hypothetical protein
VVSCKPAGERRDVDEPERQKEDAEGGRTGARRGVATDGLRGLHIPDDNAPRESEHAAFGGAETVSARAA